jgi:hypothetical protein
MNFLDDLEDDYPGVADNWASAYALADWILHGSDSNLKKYVERRWDLLNLMGACGAAILLAIPLEWIARWELGYHYLNMQFYIGILLDLITLGFLFIRPLRRS